MAGVDLVGAYGVKDHDYLDPGAGFPEGRTAVLGAKAGLLPNLTGWVEALYFEDHRYKRFLSPPPEA